VSHAFGGAVSLGVFPESSVRLMSNMSRWPSLRTLQQAQDYHSGSFDLHAFLPPVRFVNPARCF
jgi:hypothetical protein